MKKKLSLLLSVLLAAFIIGGCSGGSSSDDASTETTATEETTAESTEAESEEESSENPTEAEEEEEESTGGDGDTIILGALGTHPPFNFTDENGELIGYEVDIWKEIAKRNDLDIEFQTATFDGLFTMLDENKIDTILSQITITDERKEKYDFTEVYMYSPGGWFVREDAEPVEDFEDLHGKKVAIIPGGADEKMYEENDPEGLIEVVPFKDNQVGIQAVQEGKIDATGTSIPGGHYLLKENPDLELKITGYNGITENNAFPMSKDRDDDLLQIASDTIKEMHEDGTLKELAEKWFGIDVTVEDQSNQ